MLRADISETENENTKIPRKQNHQKLILKKTNKIDNFIAGLIKGEKSTNKRGAQYNKLANIIKTKQTRRCRGQTGDQWGEAGRGRWEQGIRRHKL